MTRELGQCPECGGRLMRCGPVGSGRTRRTCKATCSYDEPQREPVYYPGERPRWTHDARLGRAGLVGRDG